MACLARDLDSRIELDMRTDHVVFSRTSDAGRSGARPSGAASVAGSRYVADLTKADRYSYVMHLVSGVVANWCHDLDALHAYRACM